MPNYCSIIRKVRTDYLGVGLILFFSNLLPINSAESVFEPGDPPLDWISIGHGGGGMYQAVAEAPEKPDRVYTAIDVGGLYLSDDGGCNWRQIYAGLRQYSHAAQRVRAIAVSWQDPDVFYLITEGGLFSSRNAGRAYQQVKPLSGKTSTLQALQNCQLEVNPADDRDCVFFFENAFHRTTDGGQTLRALPLPEGLTNPASAAVHFSGEKNPLLVVGGEKFYLSTDDGSNWKPLSMGGWPGGQGYTGSYIARSLWFSMNKATGKPALLLMSEKDGGAVYRSDNLGVEWQALASPSNNWKALCEEKIKAGGGKGQGPALWANPNNADVLALNLFPSACFVTDDGGRTWMVPKMRIQDGGLSFESGLEDFKFLAWGFSFCGSTPGRCFGLGGMALFRSDNGGRQFRIVSQRRYGPKHYASTGSEATFGNIYVADPNSGSRYFGDDDVGLARSDDFCRSWHTLKKIVREPKESGHPSLAGMPIVTVDACSTVIIDAASKPSCIYIWENAGATLRLSSIFLKNRAQVNQNRGMRRRSGLGVSTNDGNTFEWLSRYDSFPYMWRGLTGAMVMDTKSPLEKRTFWLAVPGGVFKSTNGGRDWECLNGSIAKSLGIEIPDYRALDAWEKQPFRFGRVRLDPVNSKIIYAHLLRRPGAKMPALIKSTDGGQSWARINSPVESCWAFEISPQDTKRLYAACEKKGVYISNDGGKSWDLRFPQDPALGKAAIILPSRRHPDLLFIGVDAGYANNPHAGIFRSVDNGQTWQDVSGEIANFRIMNLREDDIDPKWLFVGTVGGGGFIAFDRLPMPGAIHIE